MYLKGVYNGTWKSGPRICYYISIISVDIAKCIVFLQLELARLGLDFHGPYLFVFYRQSVIFCFRCVRKSIFYYYTSSKKRSETVPAGFATYIVVSSTNFDISNGFQQFHWSHNVLLYAYKNNDLSNQRRLRHRLLAYAYHDYFLSYMQMISNTRIRGSRVPVLVSVILQAENCTDFSKEYCCFFRPKSGSQVGHFFHASASLWRPKMALFLVLELFF